MTELILQLRWHPRAILTGMRYLRMQMDRAVPLFTGEKTVRFPSEWAHNAQVCIVQDEPLPMTILAILPEIKVVR